MPTILEFLKLFGFALVVTVFFVIGRTMLSLWGTNAKATGFAVINAYGYSTMWVGLFMVGIGFVLTRINLVAGPDGRPHFTLR